MTKEQHDKKCGLNEKSVKLSIEETEIRRKQWEEEEAIGREQSGLERDPRSKLMNAVINKPQSFLVRSETKVAECRRREAPGGFLRF